MGSCAAHSRGSWPVNSDKVEGRGCIQGQAGGSQNNSPPKILVCGIIPHRCTSVCHLGEPEIGRCRVQARYAAPTASRKMHETHTPEATLPTYGNLLVGVHNTDTCIGSATAFWLQATLLSDEGLVGNIVFHPWAGIGPIQRFGNRAGGHAGKEVQSNELGGRRTFQVVMPHHRPDENGHLQGRRSSEGKCGFLAKQQHWGRGAGSSAPRRCRAIILCDCELLQGAGKWLAPCNCRKGARNAGPPGFVHRWAGDG